MSRVNKTALARTILAENPNTKAKELAEKLGIKEQHAYGILWKLKQPAKPKKRKGRKPSVVLSKIPSLSGIAPKLVAKDNVNHPAHYKVGGIETIDFIEAKKLSYNLGNVVKYITRANHKGNRKEDLLKAQWYLNRELSNLK